METIPKEKHIEILQNLALENSTTEAEITTFDYETVRGIVTKFYLDEYDQATVVIEDNDNKYEIEIDFIRDLILN